jgi:hypothetical protein
MVHNAVQLGIITTLYGWVFLSREDQGVLWMTRMFGCKPNLQGSYMYPACTVQQALFYFSHLAEQLPTLPETTGGQAGRVQIDQAATQSPAPAPMIQVTQTVQFIEYNHPQGNTDTYQYRSLQKTTQNLDLIFRPWVPENRIGEKTYRCTLLPYRNAIVKIWDSWKQDSSARDNEVAAYMRLESMWGRQIPTLIASASIQFFHGLILEEVKVPPPFSVSGEHAQGSAVSAASLTDNVEKNIRDALNAIHQLGVAHGDIRPDNILVGEGERVWIIDFESSTLIDPALPDLANSAIVRSDVECLTSCLQNIKAVATLPRGAGTGLKNCALQVGSPVVDCSA